MLRIGLTAGAMKTKDSDGTSNGMRNRHVTRLRAMTPRRRVGGVLACSSACPQQPGKWERKGKTGAAKGRHVRGC